MKVLIASSCSCTIAFDLQFILIIKLEKSKLHSQKRSKCMQQVCYHQANIRSVRIACSGLIITAWTLHFPLLKSYFQIFVDTNNFIFFIFLWNVCSSMPFCKICESPAFLMYTFNVYIQFDVYNQPEDKTFKMASQTPKWRIFSKSKI